MPQFIYDADGRPAFAVIPYGEYRTLMPEEALSDEELFDRAVAEDDGDRLPHEFMARLVDGEPPLKVYREWRGMTQEALAEQAGVTPGYISQAERGARHLSRKLTATVAGILHIDAADLS